MTRRISAGARCSSKMKGVYIQPYAMTRPPGSALVVLEQ
uniref:Uncharacterized protein n=1 Tax=Arundo donax TaxID=35708 RepID=A0A0A8XX84_ARUDO